MDLGTVRTLDADVLPTELGMTLAHEHVHASFGAVAGDPDLEFTDSHEIELDLRTAKARGVASLVEMSTYDMGGSPTLVACLTKRVGLRAVKSTGWFRSPSVDQVGLDTVDVLARRMIDDIEVGFVGSSLRAGVIGELGMSGSLPTPSEKKVVAAAAQAAISTGRQIVAHTDDWFNAVALVESFEGLGIGADRLMLAHMRCTDAVRDQIGLARAGAYLAFDQLGHPERDAPEDVAERILTIADHGQEHKIVISADVGRRSRLSAFGGGGYMEGVSALLSDLTRHGADRKLIDAITTDNIASFLTGSR
jgi:phosphotriesterase-related protein